LTPASIAAEVDSGIDETHNHGRIACSGNVARINLGIACVVNEQSSV